MTESLLNRIKAQLVRHEGLRLKPYRCTAGKLTIVVMNGFPIRSGMTDDCGISQKEAYAMLEPSALTGLQAYLNPAGLEMLNELKPRPPRVIRVGVI